MNERKQTADEVYQRHQDDVGALLDLIGQEMKKHSAIVREAGVQWGFVGDLAHVRESLIEVLTFLSQQERLVIEAHLNELREGGR